MKKVKIELNSMGFLKKLSKCVTGKIILEDGTELGLMFKLKHYLVKVDSDKEIDEETRVSIIYEILKKYSVFMDSSIHMYYHLKIEGFRIKINNERYNNNNLVVELLESKYAKEIQNDLVINLLEAMPIIKENKDKIGNVKIKIPINEDIRKYSLIRKWNTIGCLKRCIKSIIGNLVFTDISPYIYSNKENILVDLYIGY